MHITGMKLDAYMKAQELDDAAFAARIGRDRTTVYRLRAGITKPDWDTVIKIREETEGRVSAEDWLEAIMANQPAPTPSEGKAA